MKYVVVTGASTGIGYAVSRDLTKRGIHVFGSVRNEQDAERVAEEIGSSFTPLVFDVTNETAVVEAAQKVREAVSGQGLYGLINNAGIAVAGPLEHIPLEEIRHQFDVNLFGIISVTKAFLPLVEMTDDALGRPGRIINMSSINGIFAAPFLGPYAASKHALEALTDSLRRELFVKGVDVIAVAPGVIATPIWEKGEKSDWSPYENTKYANYLKKIRAHAVQETNRAIPPEKVAKIIYKALSTKRPRARYPVVNSLYYEGPQVKILPKRLVDWLIKQQFKLKKSD